MDYWQIVWMVLCTIGGAAIFASYAWAMFSLMDEGPKWLGWLMLIGLAVALIFGLPALVVVAQNG